MKNLTTLILFLLCSFSLFAQEVEFKYKLPLNQIMKIQTNIQMDFNIKQQPITMDMVMKGNIQAIKFENDQYTLESNTNAIKVIMDLGETSFEYDSENPKDDPFSKQFEEQMKPILSTKTTAITSSKGELIDLKMHESQDKLQNMLKNLTNGVTFPSKKLVPGEVWKNEINSDNLFLEMSNQYINKTEQGYLIETTIKIVDDQQNPIGTVTGKYTLDAISHYPILFDSLTELEVEGKVVKSKMRYTITL